MHPRSPLAPVIMTTFPAALRRVDWIDDVIYVAAHTLGELEGSSKHIRVNRVVRHLGRYPVKVRCQARKLMWLSVSRLGPGAAFFETAFKDFHPASFNEGFLMSGRA